MRQYLVGKLDHDAFALGRSHAAPLARLESGTGTGHRRMHIGLAASRHSGEQAAINGGNAVKGLAIGSGHALAVDEGTAIEFQTGKQIGHGRRSPG